MAVKSSTLREMIGSSEEKDNILLQLADARRSVIRQTVVDNCTPERLETYKKLIPSETDKSQSITD